MVRALQLLLADLKTHKVQVVIVYKVDWLTRSLADFAKIVEVFDAHGSSFVSVTQHPHRYQLNLSSLWGQDITHRT